jgi:hypothetical protein
MVRFMNALERGEERASERESLNQNGFAHEHTVARVGPSPIPPLLIAYETTDRAHTNATTITPRMFYYVRMAAIDEGGCHGC